MITVLGATGHTGGRIAAALLDAGEKVRVFGRSKERMKDLAARGAEVAVGEIGDVEALARALAGADAVYALIPSDASSPGLRASQDRMGTALAEAVRRSGVKKVVFLSSLGAELPSGTGPIAGLGAQERKLRALDGVDVLALRPTYFFENHLSTLDLIRSQGVNGGAIAPDVPFPMIATQDIAAAAAEALRKRDWTGFTVRELLGPRDVTMTEATRILGEHLGKPDLPYVQFPEADFIGALTGMGVAKDAAELYAEMSRAISEDRIRPLEGRKPENTTPTAFEDFVARLEVAPSRR